jgi:phage terminase small subunit
MANLKIKPSGLTPKRRAFVKAFVATGGRNAKQAAIAAGYSDKGNCAAAMGYQLLHDPDVLAEIRQEVDKRMRSGVALGAETLAELAGSANSESYSAHGSGRYANHYFE